MNFVVDHDAGYRRRVASALEDGGLGRSCAVGLPAEVRDFTSARLVVLPVGSCPTTWPKEPPLLVLTITSSEDLGAALRRGADVVMHREASPTRLAVAAACAYHGDLVLPGSFRPSLAAFFGDDGERLTSEDVDVVRQLATGSSMADMALKLGYSERHLRRRVVAMCLRVGVTNRTQLVMLAAKRGHL